MPGYLVRINTDAILSHKALDHLEDAVYDVVVDQFGGSDAVDDEGIGLTDVEATFN